MLCGCSGGAVAAAPGLVGAADAVVVAEADADAEPLEDEAAADVVVTGLEVAVESSLPHATSAPPVASAKAPTAIARAQVFRLPEKSDINVRPCLQSKVHQQVTQRTRAGTDP
ncbi:hypothetical protein GCM10020255_042740 [Rhodococcus baikonurensis]|jgi:hypothetical protein